MAGEQNTALNAAGLAPIVIWSEALMTKISRRSLIVGGGSLAAFANSARSASGRLRGIDATAAGWELVRWNAKQGIGVLGCKSATGAPLTSRLIKLEGPRVAGISSYLHRGVRVRVTGRGSRPDRIVCAISDAGGKLVPLAAEFRCLWWVPHPAATRSFVWRGDEDAGGLVRWV